MGHECTKLLSKVFLALDGELSDEEEKSFLAELNDCSCCLNQFEIEKMFKSYLCDKVHKKQVAPEVISAIKARIKEITVAWLR